MRESHLAPLSEPDGRARTTRAGVEKNPADAVLLQAWGLFESELGNVETAREIFSRALSVTKKNVYVYQAWGMLEWRLGELSRSVFSFLNAWQCRRLGRAR